MLNYKCFGEGTPLIILHGLFGSLDNWQSIAKKIAEESFQVYIIDQRNHGKSFHSEDFNYQLLSDDLYSFLVENSIDKAIICGHSMGGKTAMKFTLDYPEKVIALIVSDITPAAFEDRHNDVFDALFSVPLPELNNRENAEQILKKSIEHPGTFLFLLKNLYRDDNGGFQWKFNLNSLFKNYHNIAAEITGKPSQIHALFIKGQNSAYINASNYPEVERLFPKNELHVIENSGHWVHADQPIEFIKVMLDFMMKFRSGKV